MPLRHTPATQTPYTIVAMDADGNEVTNDPDGINGRMSARLLQDAAREQPTDLFLFAHGWRGDMPAAIEQYDRWIDAVASLDADRRQMGAGFKPLWLGIHWPSEPWGDEEIESAAFAAVAATDAASAPVVDLKQLYVERLGIAGNAEAEAQLDTIFRKSVEDPAAASLPAEVEKAYARLSDILDFRQADPGADPGDDHADFDPQAAFDAFDDEDSFGGSFFGGILAPLRVLSFWTMKRRALQVGRAGAHRLVAALQTALPELRVHVMGHSFGCIVASALCAGADGAPPLPRPVESLVLVQGAFSFWSYASTIPSTGKPGYFAGMLQRGGVRGPIVTTQSTHDLAVGKWYPRATSLVREGLEFAASAAEGEDLSRVVWGAVGTYGIQGATGVEAISMLPASGSYGFARGRVTNVESSEFIKKMVGASGAHSDIAGPEVAHLIWQAARIGDEAQ